jgi:uncharacterized membrane protein
MAHAENEVVINKPVAEVFGFLADGINNTKWRPGVISIELKDGQAGQPGAIYAQVLKGPGGGKLSGDYKISSKTANQELRFEVISGPARPTGTYQFATEGAGTKVKFVLDYHPTGLARLMGPMIQKTMNSEVAQLSQLKQVLEGSLR